ncbi:MAG: hypothetical protein H6Q10_2749 [Acidobacteria bacterium]|nr:hypothetical protein [Acidobacteriota bacterium]
MRLARVASVAAVAALAPIGIGIGIPIGTGMGIGIDQDLDSFMARVLERRDETWRTLHDYILSEREEFQILGPGDVPLHGERREYSWYVREGFLVRSPVRFNGVAVSDAERRAYEEKWIQEERDRERRAAEKAAADAKGQETAAGAPAEGAGGDPSLQDFVGQRGEPRFISEAYFLRFKFEPGNYYLVGREQLEGREVLRIEYYPSRLFGEEHEDEAVKEDEAANRDKAAKKGQERAGKGRDRDMDKDIERKLNKASLVTLWVDPAEHQIARYTFDNMDFGFLPGRWLVRVDGASASMTMARVLDGVWLPSRISMSAGLSLANGSYRFQYGREFFDYRKAEVGARIRNYVPRQP